ncbi:MAG: SpoIID/LytB domain-containing protein [Candidatus Eisenbacteria bacterium]|nr:SpoIID/LytB domain-containing protein [Candidatus Eisenbacteria bacterium]
MRLRPAVLLLALALMPDIAGGAPEARTPIVKIGIAPEVFSASIRSAGSWRIGALGGGRRIEEVPPGGSWRFEAVGDRLQIEDHRGARLPAGGDTLFLFPSPGSDLCLEIDGKGYRGEAIVYAAGGGRLSVVNVIDLESYLRGVLPAEIGDGGAKGFEAVKAQAVAARSYTLAHLNRWRARGFDLLPTVEDQVYLGIAGERKATDRALRETCGVLAHHDGHPIEAYYSSTCGGMTASLEDVWGRPPRPYLKARRDARRKGEESFCAASRYYRWSEEWEGADLERILKGTLPGATGEKNPQGWGRLKEIALEDKSRSFRVAALRVRFEKKSFTLKGDRVRWIFRRAGGGGLPSALIFKIEVRKSKGRVAKVVFHGGGYGHGVGLCQMGALGMAAEGADYRQILRFYYPGVRLARAYPECPW